MNLSRQMTNKLRYIIDELLPPIIRDSRVFMSFPMRFVLRHQAQLVMDFKSRAPFMTDEEIANVYKQVGSSNQRDTDLNPQCVDKITKSIIGKTVLDAGCGQGYLANKLAKKYIVTGTDIVIDSSLTKRFPTIKFRKGNVENLPFENASFDTVVCTHTLEHVRRLEPAVRELRRVAQRRLIIVVPKQRSYKYTFDLHLQFFPYVHVLLQVIGSQNRVACEEIDGDLFLIEDYN